MTPVVNPAEPKDIVGYVREATHSEVEQALQNAVNNAPILVRHTAARACRYFASRRRSNGRPDAAIDWHSGARSR